MKYILKLFTLEISCLKFNYMDTINCMYSIICTYNIFFFIQFPRNKESNLLTKMNVYLNSIILKKKIRLKSCCFLHKQVLVQCIILDSRLIWIKPKKVSLNQHLTRALLYMNMIYMFEHHIHSTSSSLIHWSRANKFLSKCLNLLITKHIQVTIWKD